jgi:hypothetical protein
MIDEGRDFVRFRYLDRGLPDPGETEDDVTD